MKKKENKKIIYTIRLTQFQVDWLDVHRELTGNKPADIFRELLDFYIALDAEEK